MEKKFLAIAVLLALAAVLFTAWFYGDDQKTVFPIHVKVEKGVAGFNVTDKLEFGSIPPGGSGRKTIMVGNTFAESRSIYFSAQGDTAAWVSVSKNPFSLEPGKTVDIDVFLSVPPDAKEGDYYGNLVLHYR